MKAMTTSLLILALAAAGCGPDSNDCPSGVYAVAAGTYQGDSVVGEDAITTGTGHELVIDRSAETATFTFTTADGREIVLRYAQTDVKLNETN